MPGKSPRESTTNQSSSQNTDSSTQQTQGTGTSNQQQNEELAKEQALTPAQKTQALVAKLGTDIGKNPLREEYMEAVAAMSSEVEPMRNAGKSDEIIARTLHQKRIDIGKKYKALTPEPLREYIFEVNTSRYGSEYGPSVDYLLKKYNGDWSKIIEGACRPNGSVDRLLQNFGQWLGTIDAGKLNAWHAQWCT